MIKVKEIGRIILIFILIMIAICFCFSLYKLVSGDIIFSQLPSETALYFLYTIGYGALEGDSVIQNILAMIGIVSLALMTTFLTINLFWRLDDVKLNKNITYNKDYLIMKFENKGKTICDMKVAFSLYDELKYENIGEAKEYYMPMLVKDSVWKLRLDLNETFWYKTVYNLLTSNSKKLYCIFSFVDTKTGQNSIKVEEITKENIRLSDKVLDYKEFTKPIIFSYKKLLPVENTGNLQVKEVENGIQMDYSFDEKANENSFVMLYYNLHEPNLNLEKYDKQKTYLEFDVSSENRVNLKFEIKTNSDILTESIVINNEAKTVRINLQNFDKNLENVREICYTIFYRDDNKNGTLNISNLKIIT